MGPGRFKRPWHLSVFLGTVLSPEFRFVQALDLSTTAYTTPAGDQLLPGRVYSWLVTGEVPVGYTYSSTWTFTTPGCAADINNDGVVDFGDYLEFLNLFDALDPRADYSGDGVVDFGDHLEFLNHFDAGC